MKRDYTTANIPVELAERIDKIIIKLGYQNRSEFIRDAVRRYLEQLEDKVDVK
jgi:metal-responsive CopG/Arc/MetJ family transcriptional regulator